VVPIGYLFVLAGALLMRQVLVGRVTETPTDIKELTVALLSGDMDAVRAVSSLRGSNVVSATSVARGRRDLQQTGELAGNLVDDYAASLVGSSVKGKKLLGECIRLGDPATYVWGASGPDTFDCSGLVWRAAVNLKMFKGARFTTASFSGSSRTWCDSLPSDAGHAPGDIVVWPGKHMGVFVDGDTFYSARSPEKGIGRSSLSGDQNYFGSLGDWYRVKG